MEEILNITLFVARALEDQEVPYLVGGSLASSLHGLPRATQDVDMIAALRLKHVEAFTTALEPSFYVDAEAIRNAIRRRSSCNVIHLETMFKVDLFIPGEGVFSKQEMERRQPYVVSDHPRRVLVVASPEDVLLHKLHWYKLGDEVSERQWRDVQGILQVQGAALDRAYLKRTAASMDIADFLERAWVRAGLSWEGEAS